MDACFSNLKELFPGHGYGYSYDLEEMVGHHRVFSRFVAACERAMPNRFRVVRYEELARSPENVVESILRDLGLNSPPGMTDTLADERPVLTASASQVRQAVHTNSIGAWRRYERQLAPIRERLDTA